MLFAIHSIRPKIHGIQTIFSQNKELIWVTRNTLYFSLTFEIWIPYILG